MNQLLWSKLTTTLQPQTHHKETLRRCRATSPKFSQYSARHSRDLLPTGWETRQKRMEGGHPLIFLLWHSSTHIFFKSIPYHVTPPLPPPPTALGQSCKKCQSRGCQFPVRQDSYKVGYTSGSMKSTLLQCTGFPGLRLFSLY